MKPQITQITQIPARRWKADLALAGITFIWGATFVQVQNALRDVSTVLFLCLRFALASAVLIPLARRVRPSRALFAGGAAVGAALFFGYLFQTWGLLYTTPSKSAFITGSAVVMVPILSGLVYRRFAGWGPLAGVLSAAAGLYLLTMPGGAGDVNRGDLLSLLCAFCFTLQIILIGHYSKLVPAAGLAAGQVATAFLLSLVCVPWTEPVRFRPSLAILAAVVVAGVLSSALAFFVQTWAQQFTTTTHTALIFSLEPVFASLTSWVVLHERLGGTSWAGAGLILAGIVVAEVFSSETRP